MESAVAGDDLQGIARSTAIALDRSVAIVLPGSGSLAQWPADLLSADRRITAAAFASAAAAGAFDGRPPWIEDLAPVRLGEQIVGVVVLVSAGARLERGGNDADRRPWLEAAAAAAAVTTLMQAVSGADSDSARRAFLQMLQLRVPTELESVLAQARRLGFDFSGGAIGVSAEFAACGMPNLNGLSERALVADIGDGRALGLVPLAGERPDGTVAEVLDAFAATGAPAMASSSRKGAAGLTEALREAVLLLELLIDPGAMLDAYEETYRLLVGVLIRDPDELHQLRERTVAELASYDESHDTELLTTLERFLAHHGSTTDTAEAMGLHRHTVGYRLARVQEVSGLSPYESEGRERLSLGLKANRILLADRRRAARTGTSPGA